MASLDSFTTNSQLHWGRLDNSSRCCELTTSKIDAVHIVDVPNSTQQGVEKVPLRNKECTNIEELNKCLDAPAGSDYVARFISICQKDSWSRLQITKPMLKKLVEHHEIDASFLEVPLSFFYRTTDEEQSFCVPWTVIEDERSVQSFYTFRYAEYKGHLNEPWVIRQAGIYHKFDFQQKRSLYILVNAAPVSTAFDRVLRFLSDRRTEIQSDPLRLHAVVQSSYFMSWRDYIAEYEKRLLPIADTTTSTMINKPLRQTNHRQLLSRLENSKRYARTFTRTSIFLQQRSNNTATLLADTLAFRNQGVAQEQNGSMVVLTRSAVFITVITLIYLPWTLVTGIFGMEFFEMDQKTESLITSPQIWIYFVTAVGTTILTMSLYYVMAGFPQIRRKKNTAVQSAPDSHVPSSLERGYTDIEKNIKSLEG
ncbi:hypothetical protein FB567DRAFT_561823 [Paraphoma chrysanthemicola]|uniref:CorA-like transporter domain-containing protein n=1 Tax=Paraphoma chrysanthemicola TaxID=798071 RepID=A0A8K0VWT7_9PLEO|nr:hypothetical protein FB567DRAFT_561823 [Paraphoma chrysanthemicola]